MIVKFQRVFDSAKKTFLRHNYNAFIDNSFINFFCDHAFLPVELLNK